MNKFEKAIKDIKRVLVETDEWSDELDIILSIINEIDVEEKVVPTKVGTKLAEANLTEAQSRLLAVIFGTDRGSND